MTEELLTQLAQQILGTTTFDYQGQSIRFDRPWRRWSYLQALLEVTVTSPVSELELCEALVGETR